MLAFGFINWGVVGVAAVVTVVLALWIWLNFRQFSRSGRFFIVPAQGTANGPLDTAYGNSRRGLYIFTALRIAIIVLTLVLAIAHLHMPYSKHHH